MNHRWIASRLTSTAMSAGPAPAFSSLELAPQNAIAGSPTKSAYNTLRNFQTRFVFNQETFPLTREMHTLGRHFLVISGPTSTDFPACSPLKRQPTESRLCGAHTAGGYRRCARVLPCLTWTGRPGTSPSFRKYFPHLFPAYSFPFSAVEACEDGGVFHSSFLLYPQIIEWYPAHRRYSRRKPRLCMYCLTKSLTL